MLSPSPVPVPELLGRKEGLENPVADGGGNAGAAIDDLDGDVVAGAEPPTLAAHATPRVKFPVLNNSAPPSGMASRALMRKVDQRRGELAAIDQRRPGLIAQTVRSRSLPSVGHSSLTRLLDQRIDVGLRGRSGCFLAKASRFAVSCDARSAASLIILAIEAAPDRA
jgi:hypothetical protein